MVGGAEEFHEIRLSPAEVGLLGFLGRLNCVALAFAVLCMMRGSFLGANVSNVVATGSSFSETLTVQPVKAMGK